MTTTAMIESHYRASRVRRLSIPPDARDIRIVHELDGILDQVQPARLMETGRALWEAWTAHSDFIQPDLLLGLDAGGIPPTVALALASGLPYKLAWKLDLELPHKLRFSEPHARRTDVYAYGDLSGLRVLLVDDEITTGHTLNNLVTVLRQNDVQVVGITCLVEDSEHNPRAMLATQEVPLCTLTRL